MTYIISRIILKNGIIFRVKFTIRITYKTFKKKCDFFQQKWNIKTISDNYEASYNSDIIVLAIKPQSIEKEANTRQELDGLWSLFCAWCVGNELSPSLVASRATFTDWYLAIRTGNEPPTSTLTSGWRSVILTPFIQFMQGKEQIEFSLCDSLLARVKE